MNNDFDNHWILTDEAETEVYHGCGSCQLDDTIQVMDPTPHGWHCPCCNSDYFNN
jgi:hypothetical protein